MSFILLYIIIVINIFLLAHIRLAVIIHMSQHISSFCERGI